MVKDQYWSVDFPNGVISFGDQTCPIQLIGSESDPCDSWLWGWKNANGLPDEEIQLAGRTRAAGKRWGLKPLTKARFALSDAFNGHNLSVVACSLADRYCYYRCSHSGGAVFVAFSGVSDSVFSPVDAQKFLQIVMQCTQEPDVDHKAFVEGMLAWNSTPCEWDGQTLIAHFQQDVRIAFEQTASDSVRIQSIEADSLDE